MPNISDRLTKALPDLPKKLVNAARYALDNPERIALDSMRTVATTCDVASPTMLRLARRLGYESYETFRNEFQKSFVEQGFGARANALQNTIALEKKGHLSEKIAQAASRNIAQTMRLLEASAVDRFAKSVQQSNRTYILGTGSMNWLAAMMESTGVIALRGLRTNHFGRPSLIETIADITKEDIILLIAIAPYARQPIEAAAYARSKKAKVFALTDKRSSPLVEYADHVFLTPTDSPHFHPSVVSSVLMVEILLSAAVAASDTLDRIQQAELIRSKSGVYL